MIVIVDLSSILMFDLYNWCVPTDKQVQSSSIQHHSRVLVSVCLCLCGEMFGPGDSLVWPYMCCGLTGLTPYLATVSPATC